MKSFRPAADACSGLVYAALITVVATVFMLMAAFCACSQPPTTAEKKAAAEGSYGAELQRCVQESATPQASDACAADVRRRWSLDAGIEGGKP